VCHLLHGAASLAAQPTLAAEHFTAEARQPGRRPHGPRSGFRKQGAQQLNARPSRNTLAAARPDIVRAEKLQAVSRSAQEEPPPDMYSPYVRQEYQCASEYPEPRYGCKDCNMNRTCSCDGLVRFGYGSKWTDLRPVSGNIECDRAIFGGAETDPDIGRGKVCMCRPKVYMCASEYAKEWASCAECNMKRTCHCVGQARFGYGETWGDWLDVNGSIQCDRDTFGDPDVGQGKVCQCQPLDLYAEPTYWETDGGSLGSVLKSIIAVVCTYFFIYALLACVRTGNELKRNQIGPSPFEKVLEIAATHCVYFAPMLCVVFFTVTKRADTLSAGSSREYELPDDWIQVAIGTCAVAFVVQTVAFLYAEWTAYKVEVGGEVAQTANFWRAVNNIATCIMYIALACTIIGVLTMEEPEEVKESVGRTPVRTCTVCTLILAVVYFAVYLVLHLFRNQEHANNARGSPTSSFGLEVMRLAATAMNFAPMLCLLFIGTQIAADWAYVTLPGSVTNWMYICSVSVLVQVGLTIVAPYLAEAEVQVVGPRGEVDFVTRRHDVFVCLSVLRWLAMIFMYLGVLIVCASLWDSDTVPSMTHPLYRFTFLYFLTYFFLWGAITARQLMQGGCLDIIRALSIAKEVVVFCPMMAALYLGSFVRAHTMTNVYGVAGQPQNYVQDCMVFTVITIVIQMILIIFASCCCSQSVDGEKPRVSPVFACFFNLATMVLFVCLFVAICGLFTIRPSNASGRGAWLV